MSSTSPKPAKPAGPNWLRIAVQVGGFALSMAALYWCYRTATGNPQLRENWPKLLDLPFWLLGSMVATSMLTIVLAALVFTVVLRPVRRLSAADVTAVSGVCTLLGYLPFKLSLVFRIFWHNRRDGVPLLVVGGWFGAVAAVILASLAAPVVAALLVAHDAMLFGITTLVLVGVFGALLYPAASIARFITAHINRKLPAALADKLHRLTAGLDMLHHPRSLAIAMMLRALDLAGQSVRFMLASHAAAAAGLLAQPLEPSQAAIAGSLFFLLQILAPTGVAGIREGGTVVVLSAISGGLTAEQIAPVVLVVSAAELIGHILFAIPSALWLWLKPRADDVAAVSLTNES